MGNNPKGEDVLAEAKEFIGEVRGDEQRAAEGRAEQEKAARELSLDEAVNKTMTETTGDKSAG